MPRYKFPKQITDAIVAGIRDCGDAIFLLSQQMVPVDKGTLKKSGRTRRIYNGHQIAYRARYAAAVEFGVKRHREVARRHHVRAHYRKFHHIRSIMTKGGVISHHWVKPSSSWKAGLGFKTIRPIDIKVRMRNKVYVRAHDRGPVVRDDVVGRVGERYLQNAIDNTFPDLMLYIQNRLP